MASKITEGLRDALAFTRGDKSKGRSTTGRVADGHVEALESIGGEPLEGSGFETEQPTV